MSLLLPKFVQEWDATETELGDIQAWTATGMLLGSVGFGRLADWIGRKNIYLTCLNLSVLFGFLSSFATSVTSFSLIRFVLGIGYGGNLVVCFPYLLELTPRHKSANYSALMKIGWCSGSTFIVTLSWLLMDKIGWQWILRISALAGVPACILLGCVAPESLRFLISKNRFEEALVGMRLICKWNGKQVPEYFTVEALQRASLERIDKESLKKNESKQEEEIVCSKQTLTTLIPLCLIWGLNSFGMKVMPFLPLEFDRRYPGQGLGYQTAFYTQLGEWIGAFSVIFILYRLPRLWEMRIASLLLGVCVVVVAVTDNHPALNKTTALIMSIFVNPQYHSLYTYSSEIFPTNIKTTSVSICHIFHRGSAIFAPLLFTRIDAQSGFRTAALIFSTFFFVASAMSVCLGAEKSNKLYNTLSLGSKKASFQLVPTTIPKQIRKRPSSSISVRSA